MKVDVRSPRLQIFVLALLATLVFVFSLLRFEGPTRGYWDTYIAVPAMFMTGQKVDLHRTDGTPRFDYELEGRIPEDTFDPDSFGISSKDQRIGAGILFSAPFSLMNMAAFRWGYALCWTLLFLFTFLGIRRILARDSGPSQEGLLVDFVAPLFGALLIVFNPFSLYLDRLNGNLFGLTILTFLFFLSTDRKPRWWLVGLVFGLSGGIRNVAIILAPMFLALMWKENRRPKEFAKNFALFGLAALVGILPVLIWNEFAYGAMLVHPSQVPHLQGWRPTFPHSFFGSEFQFNGLLNWPFHDHLVRTPHFSHPTSMLWPLVTVKSLGLVLSALALVGAIVMVARRRFVGLVLLYWYLAYYGLFFFQENWEELKQTFMALHLFPLVAFAAWGLVWIGEQVRAWRRWTALAAVVVLLAGGVFVAQLVRPPQDERWYHRFPHAGANDAGLAELPEELRKDWHFFYTRETEAEIDREHAALTRPCALPALYRPFDVDWAGNFKRIAEEPFTKEHRTLAVWSYIYE